MLEAFGSFKLEGSGSQGGGSAGAAKDRKPIFYPDVSQSMQDCDETIVDSIPDVDKVDQSQRIENIASVFERFDKRHVIALVS